MAGQTLNHDGLTFDYDDTGGSGEIAVLLHGFPASRRSWDAVVPPLEAAGYRVVVPDQRGYSPGARPRSRRAYAMAHLAGDVLALADHLGADRFHLVGHDWGSAVAWSTAAWHPERVATVTSLATPHPRALLRSMASSSQALRSWYMVFYQLPFLPEASITSGPGAQAFLRVLTRTGLAPARAEDYVRFMRSGAAGPALNWYRGLPFNSPSALGTVGVPTLYVYGSDDFALGRRAADLTGRYVDGPYRYEVLEGASHWIPEEEAEVTATLLLEHFAAHPATRPVPGRPGAGLGT